MKRYDLYSETGVNWIPSIPDHWEKRSLRSFIRLFTEKGYGDAQLLSVTRERGVIERNKDDKEENHNFVPEDLSGYKHIMPGDFVINKMKSWQGSYGVSAFEGIVSPAYFTCKLSHVDKDFFSWAIRSKAYVPFFTQYSKGIRVDQWDLDPVALMKLPFFLPSPSEQKAIVEYLDRETQKIDSFIADKEKELALLDELKQKEISNAVIHGLNPAAHMKDTGISWLGNIPTHWEVKRMSTQFTGKVEANTDFYYKRAFKFNYGALVPKNEVGTDEEYKDTYIKYSVLKIGDIVINGLNLNYDFVSQRVAICCEPGIITSAYVVCRPRLSVYADYFCYLFKGMDSQKLFHGMGTGIRLTLSFEELKKQLLPIPPVDEQKAIVDYLNLKCDTIDEMISNIEQEIEKLKEYKQRLIADAVTGQIKVC